MARVSVGMLPDVVSVDQGVVNTAFTLSTSHGGKPFEFVLAIVKWDAVPASNTISLDLNAVLGANWDCALEIVTGTLRGVVIPAAGGLRNMIFAPGDELDLIVPAVASRKAAAAIYTRPIRA